MDKVTLQKEGQPGGNRPVPREMRGREEQPGGTGSTISCCCGQLGLSFVILLLALLGVCCAQMAAGAGRPPGLEQPGWLHHHLSGASVPLPGSLPTGQLILLVLSFQQGCQYISCHSDQRTADLSSQWDELWPGTPSDQP